VAAALALAREEGLLTMLDPAPAQPLRAELLARVDILTPNENEALMLLGRPPARVSRDEAPELAEALRKLGPRSVVLKLGDRGSYYCGDARCFHTSAFPVEVRDSTAAGDTFNAGLAVALAEGQPLDHAVLFANAAAAISVTRLGAQASAPTRAEVDRMIGEPA
jgi:ribokinase